MSEQDNNVLDDVERPQESEHREVRVVRHAVEVLVRPVQAERPPAERPPAEGGAA